MPRLLLASSSVYRRQLLDKLGLPYGWQAPAVDESPLPGEAPESLVLRLAEAKARALAGSHPDSLIIGSDQVTCLDDQILGKPLTLDRAKEQLLAARGRHLTFYTSLCVLNTGSGVCQMHCELFHVHFRLLTDTQIDNYLTREMPLDCAGSFKSEGLGISLFHRLEGRDPNSLVGLPLIALVDMLNKEGIDVLGSGPPQGAD